MRALRIAGALVIVLGLAACGSDKASVMPDVTGKKLDMAKSDIKNAGFDDDVKVDGGGLFGVIDESNWVVCAQSPRAGEDMANAPELTVDRSCDGDSAESDATPSETPEPDASDSSAPESDEVLTAENNEDFAALLALKDECDRSIKTFAAKYRGRTIEFDGYIANMMNHGDHDTRYDFLLLPGNKPTQTPVGPYFKYEDFNVFDLNLTGPHVPSSIGTGDRFRFVAEIDTYNRKQCLFFLDPVSTKVR